MIKDITKFIYKKTGLLISNDVKNIFQENLQPSVRVVILMIIAAGIAYPLSLVLVGSITLPFQSTGSLLTLDGEVVGSKLIAQEFKSEKLFHIRPATNSTSAVDPHITPEDAYSQIPRISKATGLPQSTLKTAIQYNVEKNKVSNVLVFAPPYVNVLEVNLELISGYPDVYQELVKPNNINGVR
ncbi:MAG TPA: potassium-transporting ATPase subunit C [Nitrososphaeraceae archaeon]|jgi:K+-transporting ATPase ATPase C chain|nr:potassium-transporting ATPase subunit C [Nitrososphaeraceae archaeon]